MQLERTKEKHRLKHPLRYVSNHWRMFHNGARLDTPQDVKNFFLPLLLEPAFGIELKQIKRHSISIKKVFGLNGQFEPGMLELEEKEKSLDRKNWIWYEY